MYPVGNYGRIQRLLDGHSSSAEGGGCLPGFSAHAGTAKLDASHKPHTSRRLNDPVMTATLPETPGPTSDLQCGSALQTTTVAGRLPMAMS